MKIFKSIRNAFARPDEAAELEKRFDAIGKLSDPAGQLLQYRQLENDCGALADRIDKPVKGISATPMFGGLAMFLGGGLTGNFVLAGIGFATMIGGIVARGIVARDAELPVFALRDRCTAAIGDILRDPPMGSIAVSPQFSRVMQDFPGLKEQFLLAASRQKIIDSLPPPKPGNAPGPQLQP